MDTRVRTWGQPGTQLSQYLHIRNAVIAPFAAVAANGDEKAMGSTWKRKMKGTRDIARGENTWIKDYLGVFVHVTLTWFIFWLEEGVISCIGSLPKIFRGFC